MTSHITPTRGRKRFQFDLQNAVQSAIQGVEVQGFRLALIGASGTDVSLGDEDGSFNCLITQCNGGLEIALPMLVSDASEYPSDHTFFCSSQDELSPEVTSVIDAIYEDGSLTIQALLLRLLERIAKRVGMLDRGKSMQIESHSDDEDLEDDMEDVGEPYEMDYNTDGEELFGDGNTSQPIDLSILQREFNEIVAHGYQPGYIRFSIDDFALSVSLPAKSLADTISPRALMAWDKHLLSGPHHLTLLISGMRGVYPVVQLDGTPTQAAVIRGAVPHFRIGLTNSYKPSQEDAAELLRRFGLQEEYHADPDHASEQEEEIQGQQGNLREDFEDLPLHDFELEMLDAERPATEQVASGFRPFSLSSSLESLLNGHFLSILQLRIRYGLGWGGAEVLRSVIETTQREATDVLREREEDIRAADDADAELSESYRLPVDCLEERSPQDAVNLPLVAFSYLLRRLTLCPRYCLVCHQQLKDDLDALKPYVCSSPLCAYQYYSLNRGPSLEYEICSNPTVVDLLVSLAYIASAEGGLDAPLPIGMGLRVKLQSVESDGPDGLHDFDKLDITNMRLAIRELIDVLPPVLEMKRHLEQPRKPGRAKPRLQDINRAIPEAAWLVLRWCVASCTAHLEELQSEDEKVKNMDPTWRQFRFSAGAPDAEAKFRKALQKAKQENSRAREYPALYAFHGSPARNWHSIIRHGLWFKTITHGRAFGHGVYFAKDGSVSLSAYSAAASSCWRSSATRATACVALAEIVNLPQKFVSTSPYFVVDKTEWILCRYLMVRGPLDHVSVPTAQPSINWPTTTAPPASWPPRTQLTTIPAGIAAQEDGIAEEEQILYVALDPSHPLTLSQALIRIPEPSYALEKLLAARREEFIPIDYDEDDLAIFSGNVGRDVGQKGEEPADRTAIDDWVHNREWVDECMGHVMPPPVDSSPMASSALQKELRAMLREQSAAKSLRDLGWYLPEELIGDNLYQWIVELHSFESALPIARDMETHGVNSLVIEIRFPPTFPHSPPFLRIIKPRFLPFIQGGGGHITGGGSMCMDLLTADGWLPSYSISAVLLQIKLAISSLEPRPARLAHNWSIAYGMHEALEGYKRAANTHGWKIPQGLDKLTR
ncbi:hypothetical protein BV20DRAFT_1091315 [Pilatotrama ljubarskyi]|nr:hypothetical protein BV20DRAFT_1091315 [Pilatotrama ljubarskyi]